IELAVSGTQVRRREVRVHVRAERFNRCLERLRLGRSELDEHGAILRPQLERGDEGRSRIEMPVPGSGAEACEERGVLAQLRRRVLRGHEAPDAGGGLGRRASTGLAAAACAGICVKKNHRTTPDCVAYLRQKRVTYHRALV